MLLQNTAAITVNTSTACFVNSPVLSCETFSVGVRSIWKCEPPPSGSPAYSSSQDGDLNLCRSNSTNLVKNSAQSHLLDRRQVRYFSTLEQPADHGARLAFETSVTRPSFCKSRSSS